MIITVGRECGSGGHAIGEALAAHYGIRCYDRHILVSEAKAKGMYDELENFFSEKPMDSLLYSIAINNMEKRNIKSIMRSTMYPFRCIREKQWELSEQMVPVNPRS